ncbi:zinc finger protein rotund-like [Thrips palmi]|uniref:Zinc finger protein rotund-like n=1 Tax=Thrips palmi TaxID=161013 RepID=A0A6P8ZN57_THRPL|nr:zinc finger protein rotund-like [Thrips palmi]
MSVMAEHMNSAGGNPHHDGVHYMWNGAVEQCGSHAKDMEYSWPRQPIINKQGYEAKMSGVDPQGNHSMHKGMDDQGMSIYGGAPPRSASSSSSAVM